MNFLYKNRIAIALSIIKFILPYFLQNPLYELHRDEMLYLEQGHHLAWGFMEVPPLLSVFAALTHLFGGSFFWVKFWPSLFGAFNVLIVCGIVNELKGKAYAQLIAGLGLIAGSYLRVHFLFQPNFLEIFFWTLSAYYLIKWINTASYKYIYLLALALALGWLSKYSVTFFAAGIFIGLIGTPDRKIFASKHFYAAGLLAIIIVAPNLIWQYLHRWPVIHHMQELRETQLQYISPFTFLLNQVLMNIACSFVWIVGLLWLLISPAGSRYRIIAWTYLTVIVLLTLTNGKDYYALGAYPMLFAAGGTAIERLTERRFYYLRLAAPIIIVVLVLPIVPVLLPVWEPNKLAAYYKRTGIDKTGALHWEDLQDHTLPQDFADMLSWKEMGDKVSKLYASLPDSVKKRTFIYGRNYAFAGAVTYYGKGLPQVTTDNASFLFWMPDKYDVKDLLFIGHRIPDTDDKVFQQFEKYTIVDSITTDHARERGTKIILYENGNAEVSSMIERGIKEKKDEYRR